jgi:hypothetical protein
MQGYWEPEVCPQGPLARLAPIVPSVLYEDRNGFISPTAVISANRLDWTLHTRRYKNESAATVDPWIRSSLWCWEARLPKTTSTRMYCTVHRISLKMYSICLCLHTFLSSINYVSATEPVQDDNIHIVRITIELAIAIRNRNVQCPRFLT